MIECRELIKNFFKEKVATKPLGRNLYHWFITNKLIFDIRFKRYKNDKKYIEDCYYKKFKKKINLNNPLTFNEKINWRKIYDRNDLYTLMVDKYQAKNIIAKKLGSNEYTVPLIKVWDNPGDIELSSLPEKFVLKPNHAGGVIVCRNKNNFDLKKVRKELKEMLEIDYFYISREWPYKNVERKIICEEYLGEDLIDFDNFCFNGKLMYTFVWKNKSRKDGKKPEIYYCGAYDRNWKKVDIEIDCPSFDEEMEKPTNYEKMVEVAESMSKGISFLRVDCYLIEEKVYIGELTFSPLGGWIKFKDEKWDNILGNLLKLPKTYKKERI